jgi:CHASE2 domain-containing sensor protein/nitrogen-specific signal transduction histidine kinase
VSPDPRAKSPSWRWRWRDEAFIAVLLAALAAVLASTGVAWRLDRSLYDTALRWWSRPAPADVLIVAIDDTSIAALGRWPWSRAVHATLLQQLVQAKPRAVVLDLVLSEEDPRVDHDALLARVLQGARDAGVPVLLPVAWQSGSGPAARLSLLEPLPAFAAHAQVGAAEATPDEDGVVRHAFVRAGPQRSDGRPAYAHLMAAALHATGEDSRLAQDLAAAGAAPGAGVATMNALNTLNAMNNTWLREGRLAIRYLGPPGHFARVSYLDVLTGAVPVEALAGRLLLVGMTAQGLGDTLATPVNGAAAAMAGIEVHANVWATLRDGSALREPPLWALALGSALAVLAVLAGMTLAGPRGALPLALVALPVAALIGFVSVRAGWFVATMPLVFALVPAYPLWSWRRLERAMTGLDAELRHLARPGAAAFSPLPATALLSANASRSIGAAADPIAERLVLLRGAVDAVQAAQRFVADALSGLPAAVLVGDASGRVLLANARAATLFEVPSPPELQGLDLARLLAEFEPVREGAGQAPWPAEATGTGQAQTQTQTASADWAALLAGLQAGSVPPPRLVRRGTSPGPAAGATGAELLVHLAPAWLQAQACSVVALADVSSLRQAEAQREQALAFVSHDLRSPAGAIRTLGQLRLAGTDTRPEHVFVQEVQQLAERVLRLSEEFVRAAHVQTQALRLAPVAVGDCVNAAVAELAAQARAQGGGLVVHLAPALAATVVLVDRLLVERALGNLVSNALRHSPPGVAVQVHAQLEPAGSAGRPEACLCLAVQDAGPGLSAAAQRALAAGLPATAEHPQGVGLGLQFVRHVATRHGGRLLHRPAHPPPGACLVLELPARPAEGSSGLP